MIIRTVEFFVNLITIWPQEIPFHCIKLINIVYVTTWSVCGCVLSFLAENPH
jgi:hypothetical protein